MERVTALLEGLGHHIEPYAYPREAGGGPWFDVLWTPDVVHLVRERADEIGREPREDELEPMTWPLLGLARSLSALDDLRAPIPVAAAAQAIGRSMEGLHLVLSPALSEEPPPLGTLAFEANGRDFARWIERGYGFAPFATPANLAGQPAAVRPVAVSECGLPSTVPIAARPGDDLLVLRAAAQLENATGWPAAMESARQGWLSECRPRR